MNRPNCQKYQDMHICQASRTCQKLNWQQNDSPGKSNAIKSKSAQFWVLAVDCWMQLLPVGGWASLIKKPHGSEANGESKYPTSCCHRPKHRHLDYVPAN